MEEIKKKHKKKHSNCDEKEKGNRLKKGNVIMMIMCLVMGGFCGFFGVWGMDELIKEKSGGIGVVLLIISAVLVFVYIAMFLQIIIHESGHLLFGLLTGYRFSSFRIGNIMLVKINGKLQWKKYSLMGTAGQCLMVPPDKPLDCQPTVLYHLGGSIMNLASALVFLPCRGRAIQLGHDYLGIFFMCMGVIGIGYAVMNAVPMHTGAVNNDGYNAWDMRKNKEAKYACWLQLKINEQITQGVRLKDLPSKWFEMPQEAQMQNSLNATIGAMCVSREIDAKNFSRAKEMAEQLLEQGNGLVPVVEFIVKVDWLFCKLLELAAGAKEEASQLSENTFSEKRGADGGEIRQQYEKAEFQKLLKVAANEPCVIRFQYAYAKLLSGSEEQGEKYKKAFEKMADKHPISGEIESERELMELVDVCAGTN